MSVVAAAVAPLHEVVGPPHAPVILALGGISADRRVTTWWPGIAGRGRPIDTGTHRVLGVDFLDGGRDPRGRPAREVSTHDQADAIAGVLDTIGVAALDAVVGASYGGMVALAFAERHPTRVERLIVIGAAHRAHPLVTARRTVQRRIVEQGLDAGRPERALAVARALAVTTYRSPALFERRFAPGDVTAIDGYLRHQGEAYARQCPPERFLALSLSCDLHAVNPAQLRVPTTLIALEHDAIVPRAQLVELADACAAPCRILDVPGLHGHDAFLADADALGPILRHALRTDPS